MLGEVGQALQASLGAAGPRGIKEATLAAWALERGWCRDLPLDEFLEIELKSAKLAKAKQFRASARQRALDELRVEALCDELDVDDLDGCRAALVANAARLRPLVAVPPSPPVLETVNSQFFEDFRMRREMLLKRCDVTIQSFLWGDAARGREHEITQAIRAIRAALSAQPLPLTVADAAMSNARAHSIADRLAQSNQPSTASNVKKHLIGAVPQRGGNTHQVRQDGLPPPPPREHHHQRRGGRGGRGRGKKRNK